MIEIGKKIRDVRISKGISQELLAEQAKVNLRTIQRIENNESKPRGNTLVLICSALQIDMDDLQVKEKIEIGPLILNGLFLVLFNLLFMLTISFLVMDSKANLNSRFGAILLSFFIPMFIVFLTTKTSDIQRVLKYGLGLVTAVPTLFFAQGLLGGFYAGTSTGLYICIIISIGTLYYGRALFRIK